MRYLLSLLIIVIALPMFISAQATGFSYQGKLTDAGGLPTGPYDLTFRLFSTVSGGTQIGSDAVVDNVSVRNGIFTVFLDFGSSPFTGGTGNYLEISVRPGSGGNTIGSNNSAFGDGAGFSANNLTNATAIGANAQVSQSNSLVLGSINGFNGATADTNVGIGTTTPTKRLHVVGDALINGSITANTVTANTVTSTNNVSVGGIVTAFIIRANTLEGIPVLKSSNGTCWALGVDDSGGLFTVQQAQCP